MTVTNQNYFHKKKVNQKLNYGNVWCYPRLSSRLLCKEGKDKATYNSGSALLPECKMSCLTLREEPSLTVQI